MLSFVNPSCSIFNFEIFVIKNMDKNKQKASSTKFEVPLKENISSKLSLKIGIKGSIKN